MPRFLSHFLFAAILAVCLSVHAHAAEPYGNGDKLEAFSVTDARDTAFEYKPGQLEYLIVSYDMSPGKAVNKYLEDKPADYLEQHRAAYLANIHGMPGVGRFFALPKMKKYPHRILLADSEDLLARHPVEDGRVTVFSFDANGTITSIRHLDPKRELDQLFEPKE